VLCLFQIFLAGTGEREKEGSMEAAVVTLPKLVASSRPTSAYVPVSGEP